MNKQMTNSLSQVDQTPVVLIGLDGQVEITSVELTQLINQFRAEEGNTTEKQHKELLRDIRKEIEILDQAGLGQSNFAQSSYINTQNKEQPCFKLTKAGVLQMLNKESAVVRYRTVQYIEKLEKENKQLNPYSNLSPELQAIFTIDEKQQQHEERITRLEDNIHISRLQKKQLREFISTVVVKACGSKYSKAFKEFGKKAYSAVYHDLYNAFGVSSYEEIPKLKFQDALAFINRWTPSRELALLIKGSNSEVLNE